MIELLLRVFGVVMLGGGALSAMVGLAEYVRSDDTPGSPAAALALQFRIDLTDAGLLVGGGLLCLGMAAVLGVTTTNWEGRRDPYDDHPKMAREVAEAMELPDPHAE